MRIDLEIEAARRVKAKLLGMGEDDIALTRDMIEGETRLHECLAMVSRELLAAEEEAAGVANAILKLRDRQQRHQDRAERLRGIMFEAMQVAELTTMKTPVATISVRAGTAKVEIIDEASIPKKFFVTPRPVVDKKALKEALEAGKSVKGATLSNAAPVLSVRFT